MSRSQLLSNDWHRVAHLRPRFSPQVEIALHEYQGQPFYVLLDHASGQSFRVSQGVYLVLNRFDGECTVDQLWHALARDNHPDLPPQDELIELISSLFESNLLRLDDQPKSHRLARLQIDKARLFWKQLIKSPISPKIPLFNPGPFLRRTAWLGRFLYSPIGYLTFGALLLWAGLQAVDHWDALTRNMTDRALAPDNLLILLLVYPVVKTLHEFSHGWAVQRFGGQANEMGIMFLLFIPVPYIDASWANFFRHHHRRAIVSLAGIMAELGLGAVALLLWTQADPGLWRAVLFNVVTICTISTVFFNGNPLLRFDAYYALADLLQMPNLATRGNQWVARHWRRLLGLHPGAQLEAVGPAEKTGLVSYAIVSFIYRLFVTFGIAVILIDKLPVVGQFLAAWAIIMALLWPAFNGLRKLWRESRQARRKPVLLTRLLLLGATALALLLVVPLPSTTTFPALVANRETASVVVDSEGPLTAIAVQDGQWVTPDTLLAQLDPDRLRAEADATASRLQATEAKIRIQLAGQEAGLTGVIRTEFRALQAAQQQLRQQVAAARVTAHSEGRWVFASPRPGLGQVMRRGQLLGYIDQPGQRQLVGVIPDSARNQLARGTPSAEFRVVSMPAVQRAVQRMQVFPNATHQLPDDKLAEQAGGHVLTRPGKPGEAPQSVEPVIWFRADAALDDLKLGEQVLVKLHHPAQPIGFRIHDFFQREFLRRLGPQ